MPSICIGCEEVDHDEDQEKDEEDAAGPPAREPPRVTVAPDRRVIFLNIDGVLNTRPDSRQLVFEGGPCAMLRRLVEASGAELVLITPWRRHHPYIAEVLTGFGVFGEDAKPPELQRAQPHADAARRDLEVLHWLGANRGRVAAWAVLDAADLLQWPSSARLEGHFVRVSPERGLSEGNVEAALKALGGPVPRAPAPAGTPRPPASAPGAGLGLGGLGGALKQAAAWDGALQGKMEGLLGALRKATPTEVATVPVQAPGGGPPSGGGERARGLAGVPEDLRPVFRSAAAWESELSGKMDALLSMLPADTAADAARVASTSAPSPPQATMEESSKEFEDLLQQARTKFTK